MILTYPLTTVSMRAAVKKEGTKSGVSGQLEAAIRIIKEEGIQGLYPGVQSAIFGIAFTQYIYYYWYEFVKATLEKAAGEGRGLTVTENLMGSAVAGAVTAVLTNPIWVVNTRQVVKKDGAKTSETSTFAQTVMTIMKSDGILGFWKGIWPALILVINPVIQYTVFERLKERLQRVRSNLTAFDFFILGAISKLAATGITYPYIVVKSRMQVAGGADDSTRYKSVLDGFKRIIKEEGIKGLYKGIESKIVQSVLTSAFLFAFKEELVGSAIGLLVLLRLRDPVSAVKGAASA
ncbi:mitochondrial carrier domain-containing protein [Polychytrium aggregatum]|uniref:mitochondrial carrier domain-containing protein n=1 Tax=Polychytrium aggregatum TaxID=110093 RepID=UPI0022FECBBA|nr:mitochondrial carrier domain-containing protein [Polychytrium aggregatum]KAI9201967.1 mitochondrial carrier domain-containing protein [Polychytrium aggregatum]